MKKWLEILLKSCSSEIDVVVNAVCLEQWDELWKQVTVSLLDSSCNTMRNEEHNTQFLLIQSVSLWVKLFFCITLTLLKILFKTYNRMFVIYVKYDDVTCREAIIHIFIRYFSNDETNLFLIYIVW